MKIIFSRKGFDSSAGGGPSPIVGGRPVSLPIPAGAASRTSYDDLGLGEHAGKASRGKLSGKDFCHHDPMFVEDGRGGNECLFGQCGAAQTHLERQRVGIGDVFLFFGLFAEEKTREPHHRIFGYLKVDEIVPLAGGAPDDLISRNHPHALALHHKNDCIWRGEGQQAAQASQALRLTVPEGPPSLWIRPDWLSKGGLSYHDRADRWMRAKNGQRRLRSVARGQEFVADIGKRKPPREWLDQIIKEIKAS